MVNKKTIIQIEEGTKKVRHVGTCVYCGATSELSDEHIVPYGLSGTLVLEKASCPIHAAETSKFELTVQRVHLLRVRSALELKTRRKREMPGEFPVTVQGKDGEKDIVLDKAEQPILLALPVYPLPGLPSAIGSRTGIDVSAQPFIRQVAGPPLEQFLDDLKIAEIQHADFVFDIRPTDFARLIAKIGYTAAIADFGLDGLSEVYCLPAINGEADDIGNWVGTVERKDDLLSHDGLHKLGIIIDAGEISARVKLFAFADTPEYVVLLGRASDQLLESLAG